MTATLTSWEPTTIAAANTEAHLSTDAPSAAGVRPFGLTQVDYVPDAELPEPGDFVYDGASQISYTSAGDSVVDNRRILRAGTRTDTRYDNQWFDDDKD